MRGLASTRSTTLASRPRPEAKVKQRPLTTPRSTLRGRQSSAIASRCSVASTRSPGMPSILREHVGRAARQAAQRGGGAEQPVGGFVDGAVAAEGDDHVIALVRGLAAQLGGVPARLGVDRVDLEAALQRVHDEVAQAVGDGRRVRVDDDQHAPPALPGEAKPKGARRPGAVSSSRSRVEVLTAAPTPRTRWRYRQRACRRSRVALAFAESVARLRAQT